LDAVADFVPGGGGEVGGGEVEAGELGFIVVALGALLGEEGGDGGGLGVGGEGAGEDEEGEAERHRLY
jgi:hypothetical protein